MWNQYESGMLAFWETSSYNLAVNIVWQSGCRWYFSYGSDSFRFILSQSLLMMFYQYLIENGLIHHLKSIYVQTWLTSKLYLKKNQCKLSTWMQQNTNNLLIITSSIFSWNIKNSLNTIHIHFVRKKSGRIVR